MEAYEILRSVRKHPAHGIGSLMKVMLERGADGARIDGSPYYGRFYRWHWIDTGDDGISRLTDHGQRSVAHFLECAGVT